VFLRFAGYVVCDVGGNLMQMGVQFEVENNKMAYFKGMLQRKQSINGGWRAFNVDYGLQITVVGVNHETPPCPNLFAKAFTTTKNRRSASDLDKNPPFACLSIPSPLICLWVNI
jgi:hypothetical protein